MSIEKIRCFPSYMVKKEKLAPSLPHLHYSLLYLDFPTYWLGWPRPYRLEYGGEKRVIGQIRIREGGIRDNKDYQDPFWSIFGFPRGKRSKVR